MSRTLLAWLAICVAQSMANNTSSTSSDIAAKVGLCSRNTEDLDSCLTNRLQVVFPDIIKNGVPELEIEPSDPAYIKNQSYSYHPGDWTAEIDTQNTKTYGISKIQIHNVRADLNDSQNFRAKVDFTMPTILIEGDYEMRSNMFGIPIDTSGFFNISMVNVTGAYDVTGKHIEKDGEDYVEIERVNMLPKVQDMKIYASNLVPGNEMLSHATLMFFNRNWRLAYHMMLPFANEVWSKYMADKANKVFLQVPFDVLFPQQ